MKKSFSQVYRFKISLLGIRPQIWRRIAVPETYTFWDLHVAIQDSMGWLDYHLHEFEMPNPETHQADCLGIPDDEWDDDREVLAGWNISSRQLLQPEEPVRAAAQRERDAS